MRAVSRSLSPSTSLSRERCADTYLSLSPSLSMWAGSCQHGDLQIFRSVISDKAELWSASLTISSHTYTVIFYKLCFYCDIILRLYQLCYLYIFRLLFFFFSQLKVPYYCHCYVFYLPFYVFIFSVLTTLLVFNLIDIIIYLWNIITYYFVISFYYILL